MSVLVIFDTATRRVYCEDVHSMLAAHSGTEVTYDYRERWIDKDATPSLVVGARVLLVYCEVPGFDRKVDAQFYWGARPVPIDDRFFASTRTATISSVKNEAGVFHFSLRLEGYVSVPPIILEGIVERLGSRPGEKFVALSEDLETTWLLRSDSRQAWASVIDRLQSPELQFRKDAFWRIMEMRDKGTNAPYLPGKGNAFAVRTGHSVRIKLASHVGRAAAEELAWDMRRIRVESASTSDALVIRGQKDFSIRRAGEMYLEIYFPVRSEWRKSSESLVIRTEVEGALGSSAMLTFAVSHHPIRITLAVALYTVAVSLGLWATQLIKDEKIAIGVAAAATGALLGFVGSRLIPLK